MAVTTSPIANLLRVACRECRATVAFAVVPTSAADSEMHRVPAQDAEGALSDDTLVELASRASLDPEFGGGRAFVRTVQLPSATILAVAPVPGAGSTGMVGVLGDDPGGFAPPQLAMLDRLAERIGRHVRALQALDERNVEGPDDLSGQGQDRPPTAEHNGVPPAQPDGTGAGEQDATADEPSGPDLQAGTPAAEVGPEQASGQTSEQTSEGTSGQSAVMVPSLGFAAFGNEPGGAIAPSERGPFEPHPWPPRSPASPVDLGEGAPIRPAVAPDTLSVPAGRPITAPVGVASDVRAPEPPAPGSWWAATDPVTGLPSLGQFFSRAGRLLASEARASGAVALVLVEVPDERTAAAAARALAAQLRFSDPLARVDRDLFAAAVLLFPGSVRGDAVEERLGAAVRSALDWLAPVRTTHVLAEPGDRRDVDELLRQAMIGLPGRSVGRAVR